MVSPQALTAVGLVLAGLVAAGVAWPLRRTAGRLYLTMVLVVPLLALSLYRIAGTPAALEPGATRPRTAAIAVTPDGVADAVAALEAELARNPRQAEGWALLARAQAAQGQLAAARESAARAVALAPDDGALLVEAALARAQARPDRRFDDDAVAMLRRALASDPGSQRARWFLGVALRQRGDDAGAAATWTSLLADVDAATGASLRQQIDLARAASGQPPLPSTAAPPSSTPDAGTAGVSKPGIRIRVSLDAALAARTGMPDDAVVFVLARRPGGPPMPVAAERVRLGDLPHVLVLDDGDSPMPTQRLSTLSAVDVSARLSVGGTAARQGGDVESPSMRVQLPAGDDTVELVIGAPAATSP